MADNKYTGDIDFVLGGEPVKLRYDYAAIASMQSNLGNAILQDIFKDPNPELVAKMLIAGLQKHHPAITLDRIMEFSPPILPTLQVIDAALTVAYYGPEGLPKDSEKKAR